MHRWHLYLQRYLYCQVRRVSGPLYRVSPFEKGFELQELGAEIEATCCLFCFQLQAISLVFCRKKLCRFASKADYTTTIDDTYSSIILITLRRYPEVLLIIVGMLNRS